MSYLADDPERTYTIEDYERTFYTARTCPHEATSADECSMIRERSVAGVSDEVPTCPVHGPYRGAEE